MTKFLKKTLFFLQKVILFIFLTLVNFYRYMLKFILVNEGCRYSPSCSLYMTEALETHGISKGIFLGMKRILRCHPWQTSKTALYDPVPPCKCVRKDISWIQKKEI